MFVLLVFDFVIALLVCFSLWLFVACCLLFVISGWYIRFMCCFVAWVLVFCAILLFAWCCFDFVSLLFWCFLCIVIWWLLFDGLWLIVLLVAYCGNRRLCLLDGVCIILFCFCKCCLLLSSVCLAGLFGCIDIVVLFCLGLFSLLALVGLGLLVMYTCISLILVIDCICLYCYLRFNWNNVGW